MLTTKEVIRPDRNRTRYLLRMGLCLPQSPATTSLDWGKNKETVDLLRKQGRKTTVELKAEGN